MTDTMPAVRNGVDTATLFATLDAVKADPEIAAFQFRAKLPCGQRLKTAGAAPLGIVLIQGWDQFFCLVSQQFVFQE